MQEVFAPGGEEERSGRVGDDVAVTLVVGRVRGHQVVLGATGVGVVLHRRWSGAVRALASRRCATGVAFSTGTGDTTVAISVHMPTSWQPLEEYTEGVDQLVELMGEFANLGRSKIIIGGDFNIPLGDSEGARHELLSQFAERPICSQIQEVLVAECFALDPWEVQRQRAVAPPPPPAARRTRRTHRPNRPDRIG